MIHLDTSFLIRALVSGSLEDRRLRSWIEREESLKTSSIAWAEFLCGPVKGRDVDLARALLDDPVPFLEADAQQTARLFNLGGRRRGSLTDCMVAAVALRMNAELATSDPRDFRRMEAGGLKVIGA